MSNTDFAYRWGFKCALQGLIGNPYPIHSREWEAWFKGYTDGCKEKERRSKKT